MGHRAAGRAEHPEGVLLPAGAAVPACTNAPKLLYTLLALLAPVSFSRPGLRKVFALGAQPRDAGLPVWRPGAVRGEPSPRRDGGRGGSGWDGDGDPAARGGSRQGTARSPVRGRAPASPGRLQQPRGTQRSQPPHGHAYRCGGQRLSLWLGGEVCVPPAALAQRRCHLPVSSNLVPPPSPVPQPQHHPPAAALTRCGAGWRWQQPPPSPEPPMAQPPPHARPLLPDSAAHPPQATSVPVPKSAGASGSGARSTPRSTPSRAGGGGGAARGLHCPGRAGAAPHSPGAPALCPQSGSPAPRAKPYCVYFC